LGKDSKKLKVVRRGGFSERNKIKMLNNEIQMLEFDERSRIQMNNLINRLYVKIFPYDSLNEDKKQGFLFFVLEEIYSQPVDRRKFIDEDYVLKIISDTIMNDEYDDVLTLIESVIQYFDKQMKTFNPGIFYFDLDFSSVYDAANECFKNEFIGYRFIGDKISPISNEYEVKEISDAIINDYESVREHIVKANKYLADREKPDYENSIKESICAVEAMCSIITGSKGREASLGNMLKELEKKGIVIHKALQSAFSNLYGYSSDANGIRHAGDLGGPNSTFEDAKFMLVTCSAFINYLMGIQSRIKGD